MKPDSNNIHHRINIMRITLKEKLDASSYKTSVGPVIGQFVIGKSIILKMEIQIDQLQPWSRMASYLIDRGKQA